MSSYRNTRRSERYSPQETATTSQQSTPARPIGRHGSADDCFDAMARHHDRLRYEAIAKSAGVASPARTSEGPHVAPLAPEHGDILYGAKAIALFIFGDDGDRSRRRVFNLWAHYRDRKEAAGFLKLNGAVCLSKSKWTAFHGLG
jgi:hypothetical protein